jgi:hypothetical protein
VLNVWDNVWREFSQACSILEAIFFKEVNYRQTLIIQHILDNWLYRH